MTEQPTSRTRRAVRGWSAVLCGVVLAGCTSTVSGNPVDTGPASARTSSDGSSVGTATGSGPTEDFDLVLTIRPSGGGHRGTSGTQASVTGTIAPRPGAEPAVDFSAAVRMVLGGVDGLPDPALDADSYVGTLDGETTLYLKLPGATDAQIATARRALVGTWAFGLREVISGSIDPTQCAALVHRPQADRLCDPATQQVLFLGRDLGLRPSTTTFGGEDPQPGVTMTFTGDAEQVIADYTAAHVGDRLAITDGRGLVAAPTIQSAITGGAIRIAGIYTEAEARSLVGKLQLGTVGVTVSSSS